MGLGVNFVAAIACLFFTYNTTKRVRNKIVSIACYFNQLTIRLKIVSGSNGN